MGVAYVIDFLMCDTAVVLQDVEVGGSGGYGDSLDYGLCDAERVLLAILDLDGEGERSC